MIVKCLEIRDANTFIPVVAILPTAANEGQRYLIRRAGYDHGEHGGVVILVRLTDCLSSADPYGWPPRSQRTLHFAHEYIARKFAELNDGDVIDVEHILGETTKPKRSERYGSPFEA